MGLAARIYCSIGKKITDFDGVLGAWLFGSVARADSRGDSDIDLLLVLEDPESEETHEFLSSLHCDVLDWTGNELQVIEYSEDSFKRLVDTGNDLIIEIRRDGIELCETNLSLYTDKKNSGEI